MQNFLGRTPLNFLGELGLLSPYTWFLRHLRKKKKFWKKCTLRRKRKETIRVFESETYSSQRNHVLGSVVTLWTSGLRESLENSPWEINYLARAERTRIRHAIRTAFWTCRTACIRIWYIWWKTVDFMLGIIFDWSKWKKLSWLEAQHSNDQNFSLSICVSFSQL